MPILGSFAAGSGKGFGLTAGASPYMEANGGTVSEVGDYKIHVFTSPGNFVVSKTPDPSLAYADYLVTGGRGGNAPSNRGTAAGGFRESVPNPAIWTGSPLAASGGALPMSVATYPITIGANGTPQPSQNTQGNNGNASSFSTISAAGGGGGGVGHYTQPVKSNPGKPGGCGGSGGGYPPNTGAGGGSGNQPPVNPPQGQSGAWNGGGGAVGSGGGGGAAGAGTEFCGGVANIGVPGSGTPNAPNLRYFAGGSGQGGSGDGNSPNSPTGGTDEAYGGAGGPSGLVVIRYRFK